MRDITTVCARPKRTRRCHRPRIALPCRLNLLLDHAHALRRQWILTGVQAKRRTYQKEYRDGGLAALVALRLLPRAHFSLKRVPAICAEISLDPANTSALLDR